MCNVNLQKQKETQKNVFETGQAEHQQMNQQAVPAFAGEMQEQQEHHLDLTAQTVPMEDTKLQADEDDFDWGAWADEEEYDYDYEAADSIMQNPEVLQLSQQGAERMDALLSQDPLQIQKTQETLIQETRKYQESSGDMTETDEPVQKEKKELPEAFAALENLYQKLQADTDDSSPAFQIVRDSMRELFDKLYAGEAYGEAFAKTGAAVWKYHQEHKSFRWSGKGRRRRDLTAEMTTQMNLLLANKELDLSSMELPVQEGAGQLQQMGDKVREEGFDQLEIKDFSPALLLVNQQQAQEFVQQNTETVQVEEHELSQTEYTKKIEEMLTEIRNYKEELGGAPKYPDGEPRYADEVKKIFGYSIESGRQWFNKKIEEAGNAFTKGFWQMLGGLISEKGAVESGLMRPDTDYERASLWLQSMLLLGQHQQKIMPALEKDKEKQLAYIAKRKAEDAEYQRLDSRKEESKKSKDDYWAKVYQIQNEAFRKYTDGRDVLADYTRLTAHTELNGAASEIAQLENCKTVLIEQYELAKKEGRLAGFYRSLKGVCLDERNSYLEDYAREHPVDQRIECEKPADDSLYIKFEDEVPIVTDDMDLITVIGEYMNALRKSNKLGYKEGESLEDENMDPNFAFQWNQVLPCLQRNLTGKTFKNVNDNGLEDGTDVEVTKEVLEKMHGVLRDILFMVDD